MEKRRSKGLEIMREAAMERLARQEEEAKGSEDYYVDGILYCHKCNTPKQTYTDLFDRGNPVKVVCMCECEKEAEEKETQERINREVRETIIENLRKAAFPDETMQRLTFDVNDSGNSKYINIAKRYVENFDKLFGEGKGLMFYGTVGTGKTFLAACIVNALVEKRKTCHMTNFSRIVNKIQSSFEGRQEYIDSFNKYDLLVIDDFAVERGTEFVNEIIMNVVDSRYRSGKPLIITTNLTSDEMRSTTDIRKERVFSRLFEMCVPVEVKGNDRRKEKLKNEHEQMKELLGL